MSYKEKKVSFSSRYQATYDGTLIESATRTLKGTDYSLGQGVPRYKTLIKTGGDATSSFQAIKHTFKESPGTISATFMYLPDGKNKIHSSSFSGIPELISWPTGSSNNTNDSAKNDAITEFLNSLNSARSEFESLLFLGEAPETIKMINHRFTSGLSILSQYNQLASKMASSSKKSPKAIAKNLASLYLEWVFGWAPLFKDCGDLANALIAPEYKGKSLKGRGEVKSSSTDTRSGYNGSLENGWIVTETHETKEQVQITGKLIVSALGASPKAAKFGLSSYSFVPTIYELIPYSFLVDYFTNLNEIVTSVSMRSVPLAFCCMTTRTERNLTASYRAQKEYSSPGNIVLSNSGGMSYVTTRVSIKREKVENIVPVPDFQFELPGSRQLLNIFALAIARL